MLTDANMLSSLQSPVIRLFPQKHQSQRRRQQKVTTSTCDGQSELIWRLKLVFFICFPFINLCNLIKTSVPVNESQRQFLHSWTGFVDQLLRCGSRLQQQQQHGMTPDHFLPEEKEPSHNLTEVPFLFLSISGHWWNRKQSTFSGAAVVSEDKKAVERQFEHLQK